MVGGNLIFDLKGIGIIMVVFEFFSLGECYVSYVCFEFLFFDCCCYRLLG